jgi:hypothetical protein
MTIPPTVNAPSDRLDTAGSRVTGLVSWVRDQIEETTAEPSAKRKMSYQNCLRAVGAWLDSRDARSVNLIEAPAGFVVRYLSGEDPAGLREHVLSHAEIRDLEAEMRARRAVRPNGRYGDFWRALGYEIDERGGVNLLLDEIEGNLLVSYLYQRPDTGLSWNKHASVLNDDDRTKILRRAYARRREPDRGPRFWDRMFRRRPVLQPVEVRV